jgi:peptidoglycan hydrolase-like protein with peptidoglycan-binding domain
LRRLALIAGAALLVGGALVGAVVGFGSGEQSAARPALPPATAKVTRTTLVETKTVSGTLGYGDPVPVRSPGRGTLTRIAPVGSTVKRGEPLLRLDERPVVALYGRLPLYRPLRAGAEGADVQQLERNLKALGYRGFTVDDTYSWSTAAAVRRWQADLDLVETGAGEPGQVVFTPGPVRIAAHTARVGDSIGGGPGEGWGGSPVLSYSGTSRLVTVELEVLDQALAREGRTVTVTVPGVGALNGRISSVGTVVTASAATSDGANAASEAAGAAASDPVLEVSVTIANQKALGSLDAAPVDVDFVSAERKGVLAVPVAALLALAQDGFGVELVEGETTRIVPVKTGMFAAGRVEISGTGIRAGATVGVAK